MSEGAEAFAIRTHSARLAMRSLDVQTFIWRADLTGTFLAYRLLEAADRGVRVRVLIDDFDARHHRLSLAALAAHRNIAVRLFNPFASPGGALRMLAEALLHFDRLNRRMHNKTWIVDGRMAIVGGRNLGDEYFAASDATNFVDLDFAMFGPVVRDAEKSFEAYWRSPATYTIEAIEPEGVNDRALATLRNELDEAAAETWSSRYADVLRADDAVQRLVGGDWPMQWSSKYRLAADDPHNLTMKDRDLRRANVRRMLLSAVQRVRTELVLISPYFVPSTSIVRLLADAVKAGNRVRVLTNSLAASDMSAVHGGYSRHRKALLASGVELWELKRTAEGEPRPATGRSSASLHTKAVLIDGKTLFVGSYNLDPRSAWLNCEQGVLLECEPLAQELMQIIERHMEGRRSWRVTLAERELRWSDGRETFSQDPRSSFAQRLQARLVRMLRLDRHL